jgi:hypothetical protein
MLAQPVAKQSADTAAGDRFIGQKKQVVFGNVSREQVAPRQLLRRRQNAHLLQVTRFAAKDENRVCAVSVQFDTFIKARFSADHHHGLISETVFIFTANHPRILVVNFAYEFRNKYYLRDTDGRFPGPLMTTAFVWELE